MEEFDPRTQGQDPFVPATTVRVAGYIERSVEPLTTDPHYRILFGEILKHFLLGLLLTLPFLLFKYLSKLIDPKEDWFESIVFYCLRILEVGLIILIAYIVIVGLLEVAIISTGHRWRRVEIYFKTRNSPK